jgi:hypothetical protein
MAMASISKLFNRSSDSKNVDVYLLFKAINQDHYTDFVEISHWQVVCHFKDVNRYKCYELRTDTGGKLGKIAYRISNFQFNGTIYYYYIGQCDASETEIERKCDNISINGLQYIVGLLDCQLWAALLIKSLGLSANMIESRLQLRPIESIPVNYIIRFLLSKVKRCHGYQNLDPTR